MDKASEVILSLRPVSFRYKKEIDAKGEPQFGLVAEDVARTAPDLVVTDDEGKPFTVRYDEVNAMLLNEFLKEHRKVEHLEVTVAQQQKDFSAGIAQEHAASAEQWSQIKALSDALSKQAAQLQKVSDALVLQKSTPRVAANNQ